MTAGRPHLLPSVPDVPADLLSRVKNDHDRFAREGLPANLEAYLLDAYALDMTGSYAGLPVRNPWGKASGQLTLNLAQLEEAAAEGLGFAVLKTVIAQDAAGRQSMGAWALKESRMVAEPITSPLTVPGAGPSPGEAGAGGSRSTTTSRWFETESPWDGSGACRSSPP